MPATAQLFHWVYAAKFLCGELKPTEPEREGPAEAGRYATAINVHNPGPRPIAFRKKAVLLFDGSHPDDALERPIPPRRPVARKLGPDWGLEMFCLRCFGSVQVLLHEAFPQMMDYFVASRDFPRGGNSTHCLSSS